MEKCKIGGIRTPKPLNRLSQNVAWVISRRYDPASQNSNRSPQWGRPGKWVKYHSRVVFSFFSKRQRITLRLLYAIGLPSVVCLSVCLSSIVCLSSVTLVHPTQAVELFGNFFHHTIAQGLYFFSGAKNGGGRPFPPEICVQSDPPSFKQRNFLKYRLIAPQPS